MEEVESRGKITIEKNNHQIQCNILFVFENKGVKYVGYTDYSISEDERINIYVNTYNSLTDISTIKNIVAEEELEIIQKALEKITKSKKNIESSNDEVIRIYQSMEDSIEKYTKLNKEKATTREEQTRIAEEKELIEENIKRARSLLPKELLDEIKEQQELKIKVEKQFKNDVIENHKKYKIIPIAI